MTIYNQLKLKQMKLKSILFAAVMTTIATLLICFSPKRPYRRDYQIEVTQSKMQVWDGERYVGELPFYDTANLTALDNLIILDNQ